MVKDASNLAFFMVNILMESFVWNRLDIKEILKSYKNDSVLYQSIDKGKELFKIIPREIDEKLELI